MSVFCQQLTRIIFEDLHRHVSKLNQNYSSMTRIVTKWIHQTLGLKILNDFNSLADFMRNGHFVAQLLLAHQVIGEDEADKVLNSDPTDLRVMEENFKKHIRQWLKLINIHLTPDETLAILYKNENEAVLRLFQIYLALNPHDHKTEKKHKRPDSKLDLLLDKCRRTKAKIFLYEKQPDNSKLLTTFSSIHIEINNIIMELHKHNINKTMSGNYNCESEVELNSDVLNLTRNRWESNKAIQV